MTDALTQALNVSSIAAIPIVLAAGLVSGLNPCCIPLYPTAIGAMTAFRRQRIRDNLGVSVLFIIGVSLASTILGIVSGLAGRIFVGLGSWPTYIIAVIPLVFGLHMLGVIKIPLPKERSVARRFGGPFGAIIAGVLIGLVVTPCATPVLASLLAYVASTGDPVWGGFLLFIYGVGLGFPILIIGTASASLMSRLTNETTRKWVERVTGVILIGVALYMIWIA